MDDIPVTECGFQTTVPTKLGPRVIGMCPEHVSEMVDELEARGVGKAADLVRDDAAIRRAFAKLDEHFHPVAYALMCVAQNMAIVLSEQPDLADTHAVECPMCLFPNNTVRWIEISADFAAAEDKKRKALGAGTVH